MSTSELKDKLFYSKKNANLKLFEKLSNEVEDYCNSYKSFLDCSKTEREACANCVNIAEKCGFVAFSKDAKYRAGDRIYAVNRGKNVILAIIGKKPLECGVKFAAAHVDSPRLDLKQNPLYEDSDFAFFKTHYYGGIKKYQWTAIPLALHGVVFKASGQRVDVKIGEDEADPVFCVNDLLPHLAANQMKRPAKDIVGGEDLNILIGSRPFKSDEKSEMIKLNILKILNEKYGIVERDFVSAELEAVPAFKAKDVGFDRSFVGAYGQDDRVCGYNSLKAILDCENPEYTVVTMLADKEEIGSEGNTGMKSYFLEYFIEDLARIFGTDKGTVFSNSECLSADVGAAFDPSYADAYERKNSAMSGYGTIVTKYTGARGKSGTSDASAEFVDKLTRLLDSKNIVWQTAELGKVDAGGGGTVAMFLAKLNMEVIDLGVPILSMHSPFEVASKVDIFENYRAIRAFFEQE